MGLEQSHRINVWLQRQISNFRILHTSAELRKDYKLMTEKNNSLLWEDYMAAKALSELAENRPFLKTSVWDFDLPETCKESLYKLYIDTAADLMQFSQEELTHFSASLDISVKDIKNYLSKNGFRLTYKGIGSRKLSYLKIVAGYKGGYESDAKKVFDNPSLLTGFNIDRPSLDTAWFDEYYKRYIEVKDENLLLNKLKKTKLRIKDGSNHFGPYHDFFYAETEFWDAYWAYCTRHELEKEKDLPRIPQYTTDLKRLTNDYLLSMKKKSVRAAISIFRHLTVVGSCSIGTFLEAEDEVKLDLCERLNEDGLQLLLILYIEIGIDFENLLLNLMEKKERDDNAERDIYLGTINPWLREQIEAYRKSHKDDDIRTAYEKAVIERPDLVWIIFLREQAIQYACQMYPCLSTYVEDTNLNDEIKNTLYNHDIIQVVDIMQHTDKEYYDMFNDDYISVNSIEDLLKSYGLKLYSDGVVTYKDLLPF